MTTMTLVAARVPGPTNGSAVPNQLAVMLKSALADLYGGNKTRLADAIGISRQTLYRWMKPSLLITIKTDLIPKIADAIARDEQHVRFAVLVSSGHELIRLRPRIQVLARILNELDDDDLDEIEREAIRRIRRNRAIRKGQSIDGLVKKRQRPDRPKLSADPDATKPSDG